MSKFASVRHHARKYVIAGVLSFVLCSISTLTGCYANMHLYPVRGPLSAQTPLPAIKGKVTRTKISVVLPDGEKCSGPWKMARVPDIAMTTATGPASNDIVKAWDSIYGPGFYTSHVLGSRRYARGVLSGAHGTVLRVELYQPDTEHGDVKGVAQDNTGNIYKVVF